MDIRPMASMCQYNPLLKTNAPLDDSANLETVNYFRRNNTDVYVLLLDASQAFDQVNYVKLCQLLLNRNPLIRCTCICIPINTWTSDGTVVCQSIVLHSMA